MTTWIAISSLLLALIPSALFVWNLRIYTPLPRTGKTQVRCSVLIPARNEEANIAKALRSVLRNGIMADEIIVLDDASTDRTAGIVRDIAASDARVRLETAPPLPPGWCGKQHACHTLAHLAMNPLIVFMDADVRLRADALVRMAAFMERSGAALASGVPRQQTGTFSEILLIPLIHFILLGFLPMGWMRRTKNPAFGAGCGQLFIARRDAYLACGGHARIPDSLHDGAKLPRAFREGGFSTDLFDATDLATCRMFLSNASVWPGLARNAHEGLGSARLIVPATLLLFGGQVLPFILLAIAPSPPALAAVVVALLPRLLAVVRFRQPLTGLVLHPVGICALIAIQWFALVRTLRRRPAVWKGRAYAPVQAI